jgi:hypothetical protein
VISWSEGRTSLPELPVLQLAFVDVVQHGTIADGLEVAVPCLRLQSLVVDNDSTHMIGARRYGVIMG